MSFRQRLPGLKRELSDFGTYALWAPLLLGSLLNKLHGGETAFRQDLRSLWCALIVLLVDLSWTVSSGVRYPVKPSTIGVWRFGTLAAALGCSALVLGGAVVPPPLSMIAMFAAGALALIHHQNKVRNV